MRSLLAALYAERRALYGCLVILFRATLVAATTMHLVERQAQPDKFGTISSAMWWAIGTLSTIGYGDVVPITNLGKLVAAATVVTGLIMVALPIGIVATAFANEVHRRDLRRHLEHGGARAGICRTERHRDRRYHGAPARPASRSGRSVVRRGEPAHSMYFVAAGEVEIKLRHEHIRLGPGHFFGEIAALQRARPFRDRRGPDANEPAGARCARAVLPDRLKPFSRADRTGA
jgi:voltage-gated potassium channel